MCTTNQPSTTPPKPIRWYEPQLATRANTSKYGYIIDDQVENPGLGIPFYRTVIEGANYEHATWKDSACVRTSQIHWREDHTVTWLERHMDMTQGFVVIGKNPGLFVLGEPTHDRMDLPVERRGLPDPDRIEVLIIPPGNGLILKKGTWHDFPVSCGPPVSAFILNSEEVVEALASMSEPAPMNHGDCFKLRLSEHFTDVTLKFRDPRPYVRAMGLLREPLPMPSPVIMGEGGYGLGMVRSEVTPGWTKSNGVPVGVTVIPVINVEVFVPGAGGPGIQPHLQSSPEIANRGWRDYGNRSGLRRLVDAFQSIRIPATAVVNSDAPLQIPEVSTLLKRSGWEIGAHGINNSSGMAHMDRGEEEATFGKCLDDLERSGCCSRRPTTWLSPQFSITERTPEIAASAGIDSLLDFVDDDVPYYLTSSTSTSSSSSDSKLLCVPYSMETNDFSLCLTKHHTPRQYAEAIEDHILQLASEKQRETVVCLGMHTFVAGTPARVKALVEMFTRLKGVEGVRFSTVEGVCKEIRENEKVSQGRSKRVKST